MTFHDYSLDIAHTCYAQKFYFGLLNGNKFNKSQRKVKVKDEERERERQSDEVM